MALGDWPIDHSVQTRNKGVKGGNKGGSSTSASAPGLPPDGHPRRCQAKNWQRLQCKQWAKRDQIYCWIHFKKFKTSKQGMSYIYQLRAKKKLSDYLKEISELNNRDDLSGEIDSARAISDRALHAFEKVCLAEDDGKEISSASKLGVMNFCLEAFTKVSALITAQAKINAINAITPEQMAFVNQQMISVLKKTLLPANEDLFIEIVKEFDDLKIPEKNMTINIS